MPLSEDEVFINIKKVTRTLLKKLCEDEGVSYDRLLQRMINDYLMRK